MTNSTKPLSQVYSDEESNKIFGKLNATLEERTVGMISLWGSFKYKAPINSKEHHKLSREFVLKEKLKIYDVMIRGRQIGFKDKMHYTKYLLKVKHV